MSKPEKNGVLIPYFIISAAVAAALCFLLSYRGWALVGMFVVFYIAAFAALWLLLLIYLTVISFFIDPTKPQRSFQPFFNRAVTYVMALLWAMARVRIHVSGAELIPTDRRFMVVCNHRSNYDPIILGWVLRDRELAFISKPENLRIPMVGRFLHKACYLAIDRDNDREALKTILAAIDLIKRDVVSIGVFPEGTRHVGEEMLPFRNGAFKIAQRAKCPVLVAAIRGTENIRRFCPWRDTDVYLDFVELIGEEQVARMNTVEIGEHARTCMTSALSAAS